MPSQQSGSAGHLPAQVRLKQIASHIDSKADNKVPGQDENASGRRRRKGPKDGLPADYSDILGQLDSLRKSAATPDLENRGYVRQKQAGKLWVRERVEQLLDPGSFREVGSVSGTVRWKQTGELKEEPIEYLPSNNVQGRSTRYAMSNVQSSRALHDEDGRKAEALQVSARYEGEELFLPQMTSLFELAMLTER